MSIQIQAYWEEACEKKAVHKNTRGSCKVQGGVHPSICDMIIQDKIPSLLSSVYHKC